MKWFVLFVNLFIKTYILIIKRNVLSYSSKILKIVVQSSVEVLVPIRNADLLHQFPSSDDHAGQQCRAGRAVNECKLSKGNYRVWRCREITCKCSCTKVLLKYVLTKLYNISYPLSKLHFTKAKKVLDKQICCLHDCVFQFISSNLFVPI